MIFRLLAGALALVVGVCADEARGVTVQIVEGDNHANPTRSIR